MLPRCAEVRGQSLPPLPQMGRAARPDARRALRHGPSAPSPGASLPLVVFVPCGCVGVGDRPAPPGRRPRAPDARQAQAGRTFRRGARRASPRRRRICPPGGRAAAQLGVFAGEVDAGFGVGPGAGESDDVSHQALTEMQKLSVHKVVLRPPTRSPVRPHSSRFPAWRTGGLGVVADELALVAARLDPRSTWPSPAARVLIGMAGSARVNAAVACDSRVALGRRMLGVAFVHHRRTRSRRWSRCARGLRDDRGQAAARSACWAR